MSKLNEVIIVFHCPTVPTEKMLYKKTMILLCMKAAVFNAPSATTITNCLLNILLCQRFVCVFFFICIHAFLPCSWIHLTTQIFPAKVSTFKGVPLNCLSTDVGPPKLPVSILQGTVYIPFLKSTICGIMCLSITEARYHEKTAVYD